MESDYSKPNMVNSPEYESNSAHMAHSTGSSPLPDLPTHYSPISDAEDNNSVKSCMTRASHSPVTVASSTISSCSSQWSEDIKHYHINLQNKANRSVQELKDLRAFLKHVGKEFTTYRYATLREITRMYFKNANRSCFTVHMVSKSNKRKAELMAPEEDWNSDDINQTFPTTEPHKIGDSGRVPSNTGDM